MSSQVGIDALRALFEDIATGNDTFILCFHEYGDYKEVCFMFKWYVNLSATCVGCNLKISFEEVKLMICSESLIQIQPEGVKRWEQAFHILLEIY